MKVTKDTLHRITLMETEEQVVLESGLLAARTYRRASVNGVPFWTDVTDGVAPLRAEAAARREEEFKRVGGSVAINPN